jgi:hypothetical protein
MGGAHLGEAVRRTGEAFRRDPSFGPDPVDRQIGPAPLGEETAAPAPAPAPAPSGLLGGLRPGGIVCDIRRSASAMARALNKKATWMMVCQINTFSS